MPANLSPEYKSAEVAFKKARDPQERLTCLREMLRTIPKHKGTERLQADIKTRIKNLNDELTAPGKGGGRSGPVQVIHPEGAAQIALLGPPNSGKSTLHARLTGSHAATGPYPFTTHEPLPGMLPYEDIHFQLVDLPPISPEHMPAWIGNALQPADAAMLVVDLSEPDCVEQVAAIRELLAGKRVTLLEQWDEEQSEEDEDIIDPFAIRLPTVLVAAKADLSPSWREELQVLEELLDVGYPTLSVSVESGQGLDEIGAWLFQALHVVRVYTKAPGRTPDKDKPFTVRRGDTVHDVAQQVHRDLAGSFKFARLWGSGQHSGQQVGRDHPVNDGDVLELHE
jgi:ribosome-interacting GTPase 1